MSGKKFRFSLQRVLDLRRRETENTYHSVLEALRQCKFQRAAVEAAERRLENVRSHSPSAGATGTLSLMRHNARLQQAMDARREAQMQLATVHNELEEAREAWHACCQAEEGIQKLFDKEKSHYDEEQEKIEIARLDEQAIIRYNRSNSMMLI